MKRLVTATILVGILSACGQQTSKPTTSKVDFISLGSETAGLVGHVKKPTLLVCLAGVSQADLPVWTTAIKQVALSWVKPLRALTSDQLTSSVEVTTTGGDCDSAVNVVPGTWSNTQIGDNPTTTMDSDGYFSSYNVLAHEFGHQFALGDTYTAGGQSGQCIPGQPAQAIMCDTSYKGPQPDDVAGITEIFQAAFPNDRPGTPATTPSVQMFAGLGAAAGQDDYSLALSLVGASASDGGTLSVCFDEAAACAAGTGAKWQSVAQTDTRGSVLIYAMTGAVQLKDGLALTVRYQSGQSSTQSEASFHFQHQS